MEAIVILPDMQYPLHDQGKIDRVVKFIHDFQPDGVGHVGDLTDSTQIGRWTKGLRGEFDGGLEFGFEKARTLFTDLRSGYKGPIHLSRSNHDIRLADAIEKRLPGIAGLTIGGRTLNIQNALQLDKFDVEFHEKPYEIAPGWLLMHGDEGGLSNVPGNTALQLAAKARKNVVCGHTHRAGLAWSSSGVNGLKTPVAGLEVGHLCDPEKMEYLGPARLNNWANAFGMLWIHRPSGKQKIEVFPELVPIQPNGNFVVAGKLYGK